MKKAFLVTSAAVVALAPVLPASAATTHDVAIQGFTYQPPALSISVGDSVRWTNNDFIEHTATKLFEPSSFFNTGTLTNAQSATIVFTSPGLFEYYCAFHTDMRGTVNVLNAPEPVIPEAPLPALLTAAGATLVAAFVGLRRRFSFG